MVRLEPLADADADAAQADFLAKAPPLNLFRTVAHAPSVAVGLAQLGGAILYSTKLEAKARETAILRVGHATGSSYEVAQHRAIGLSVGITAAQVEAIAVGSLDGLTPGMSLAARWADEVTSSGMASAALVDEAMTAVGPAGTVELATVVGYYLMLSTILRTFEVQVEGGERPVIDIQKRPDALER